MNDSNHPTNHSSTGEHARPVAAIILAAGLGKRMGSDLPKVVHRVADEPMVRWVVEACRAVDCSPIVLVVGHGSEHVREIFSADDADLIYARQPQQHGTGHATACAAEALADFDGDVFVLAGDGPLIRADTLRTMLEHHRAANGAATLATAVIEDPTGYGRIVRDKNGRFDRIVEHKNATDEQSAIHEIYPSYACFDARLLFDMLPRLERNETTGEYYITDVPEMLKQHGHRVQIVDKVPPEDVLSINTPEQLAEVDAILRARLAKTS